MNIERLDAVVDEKGGSVTITKSGWWLFMDVERKSPVRKFVVDTEFVNKGDRMPCLWCAFGPFGSDNEALNFFTKTIDNLKI